MSGQSTPVNASDVVTLDMKNLSGSVQFRVTVDGDLQWKLLNGSTWFKICNIELLRGRSITDVTVNAQNKFVLTFSDLTTQVITISALEDAVLRATNAATQALASAGAASAVAMGQATARPIARPSFYLDLSNSRFWPSRLPFARASVGTYIDKFGNMKLAASHKPRFTHDPLTKECKGVIWESIATNYLKYSNDFTNAAWIKTRLASSFDTTKKGVYSQYAPKLTVDGTNDPLMSQSVTIAGAGKTWTFSIYVWTDSSTPTKATLRLCGSISEELVTKYITVTNVPTRFSITKTFSAGFISPVIIARIDPFEDETDSPAAGRYMYIDCAQLEENSEPSSFIPTSSLPVTRQNDNISVSGALFDELFPSLEEGTLHVIAHKGFAIPNAYPSYVTLFQNNPTNGQNSIRITNLLASTDFTAAIYTNGVAQTTAGLTTPVGNVFSTALAWKAGDAVAYHNGVANGASAPVIPTGINTMSIEGTNGIMKVLAFWPKRLDNVTLQALTTNGLSGKSSNQIPTNGDIGGSAFLNPYDLLRNLNRQEFSVDCTGSSITRNIRRPYPFLFEIVDSSGVTVNSQPASSCVENTDNNLVINGAVGKTLTYAITPIFEY